MRAFLVLMMLLVRQWWHSFVSFWVYRLKQKSMAVVMWRTLHQRMSLTRGM